MEEKSDEYITNQLYNYLYRTSKELKSDISGIGTNVSKNFLTQQDLESYDWLKKYENCVFNCETYEEKIALEQLFTLLTEKQKKVLIYRYKYGYSDCESFCLGIQGSESSILCTAGSDCQREGPRLCALWWRCGENAVYYDRKAS